MPTGTQPAGITPAYKRKCSTSVLTKFNSKQGCFLTFPHNLPAASFNFPNRTRSFVVVTWVFFMRSFPFLQFGKPLYSSSICALERRILLKIRLRFDVLGRFSQNWQIGLFQCFRLDWPTTSEREALEATRSQLEIAQQEATKLAGFKKVTPDLRLLLDEIAIEQDEAAGMVYIQEHTKSYAL